MPDIDARLHFLEILEKTAPEKVTLNQYRELMGHFNSWHTCESPLARRAKAVLVQVHRHIKDQLEE